MKKFERQDKYENHPDMSNVIKMTPQPYNKELDELHHKLLDFALINFENDFFNQAQAYDHPFLSDHEDAAESYLTGITLWTIFNVPIFENKQSIFDVFYNQKKAEIKHTRTRKIFSEWADTVPSVYEILSIDHEEKHMATIKELLSDQEFQVPLPEEEELAEGNLVIGSLIPYSGYYAFFFNMLEIYRTHKERIVTILRQFSEEENKLSNTFPDFLAEVLHLGEQTFEWDNPLYEMVANLFENHMTDKQSDEQTIVIGIMIWHIYCQKKQPVFKNPATYAAALDYLVQHVVNEKYHITQKQVAEEYDTTAQTVSINYRKILHTVEKDMLP